VIDDVKVTKAKDDLVVIVRSWSKSKRLSSLTETDEEEYHQLPRCGLPRKNGGQLAKL
jgi:hypothetical protein